MSYCGNAKGCVNTNYNNYAGSGGSMLKRKHANKFNKVSSNKMFSINGYVNHNYIGNSNTITRNDPFSTISENSCCANNDYSSKNTKGISVKSVRGYLNSKVSSVNSAQCYKCVSDKKDYLSELVTNKSSVTCSNKVNRIASTNARIHYLINCNNSVKDTNYINGFTPAYDIYYNDSTLFSKKSSCNLFNPPDAKVIAC